MSPNAALRLAREWTDVSNPIQHYGTLHWISAGRVVENPFSRRRSATIRGDRHLCRGQNA